MALFTDFLPPCLLPVPSTRQLPEDGESVGPGTALCSMSGVARGIIGVQ